MRRVILLVGMFASLSLASEMKDTLLKEGYKVYKRSCASCHVEHAPPEKLAKIRELVKAGKKPPFKAPPMSEVSARVKKFYPDELAFVEFVKDYITNPSREKGVCMPMAFKIFGVMPPIGKQLKEEEKEAVATWLYHRFTDSWEEFIRKHPH